MKRRGVSRRAETQSGLTPRVHRDGKDVVPVSRGIFHRAQIYRSRHAQPLYEHAAV